jgi:hypothetical protein
LDADAVADVDGDSVTDGDAPSTDVVSDGDASRLGDAVTLTERLGVTRSVGDSDAVAVASGEGDRLSVARVGVTGETVRDPVWRDTDGVKLGGVKLVVGDWLPVPAVAEDEAVADVADTDRVGDGVAVRVVERDGVGGDGEGLGDAVAVAVAVRVGGAVGDSDAESVTVADADVVTVPLSVLVAAERDNEAERDVVIDSVTSETDLLSDTVPPSCIA